MPISEAPATEGPLTHQCGRCRRVVPLDPQVDPHSAGDWWACAECRAILLPDMRP